MDLTGEEGAALALEEGALPVGAVPAGAVPVFGEGPSPAAAAAAPAPSGTSGGILSPGRSGVVRIKLKTAPSGAAAAAAGGGGGARKAPRQQQQQRESSRGWPALPALLRQLARPKLAVKPVRLQPGGASRGREQPAAAAAPWIPAAGCYQGLLSERAAHSALEAPREPPPFACPFPMPLPPCCSLAASLQPSLSCSLKT